MTKGKAIGIIGYGNMGSAITQRIKNKYKVIVFDKEQRKINSLPKPSVARDIKELIESSEVIILAVKPQDFDSVLQEMKDYTKNRLIISIAAGIATTYIEKKLQGARVIRTMPNLPAKVGAGMTCLYKGRYALKEDLEFSRKLFNLLGKTIVAKDEEILHVVTASSGSGPGFWCDLVEGKTFPEIIDFTEKKFIPAFTTTTTTIALSANTNLVFTPVKAKILAEATGRGMIKYLRATHLSPEEVKKQVVSKNGTTEAGLKKLKHNIANLTEAAKAALKRSKELAKR